ncbi:MAG: carboxypeptidase regulatory-like domain-containing protein, partial [Desulfuromonadaceae bacterium]|nr:carboxypeptidase regulatory-like domain-containing protein [Desulfuromonadaceae bacterium]
IAAPAFTISPSATCIVDSACSVAVKSTSWPMPTYTINQAPAGMAIDATTGVFSGTPAAGTAGDYQLTITASNGIPPDAVRSVTLNVLPASSLSAAITTPAKGSGLTTLTSITGTATGTGLSKAEVQITDGAYFLQTDGSFTMAPSWLLATGTTNWSLNTAATLWREGITYTINARASDGTTYSAPSTSTFTIQIPATKTGTILTLNDTTSLRAGNTTSITGTLVKTDATTVSGGTVTLIITPPSSVAVPFPAPIVQTVTTDGLGNFTTGALNNFALPGVYMIQARFEGNDTLAASFATQALGVTPQSGYAIIITGKASDNSLLDLHTASTDTIYSTLVNKRGFLPDNILRLTSTDSTPVTRQQIQDSITIWAKDKLVTSSAPLYLIMIDHGSTTGFLLGDDTNPLTPTELKEYLDTLESDPQVTATGTLTDHNRIIMIGTCYSGIFAPVLSKPGRIILTSANTDEQSIAGFTIYNSTSGTTYNGGEYFIDNLFNYLGRGDTLKDAFSQSSNMVELRDPRKVPLATHAGVYDTLAQHPLLDDNGDGKPSYLLDTDGKNIANMQIGVGIRTLGNPADITEVTGTAIIPTTETAETPLWLRVNDNSRIARAWMEIRTPIATADTSKTGQVIPRLISSPLYYDGIQWNGSYSFPNPGTYKILYYTQDNQTGDIAPAKNSTAYKQLANNTAPNSFTLTSPEDEAAVSGIFQLNWETVTSPNKITYTLKVATDPSFTNTIYTEEGIPQNGTYITKDPLTDPATGIYYCQNGDSYCYWKIQAIDSYGAAIESTPRSFTIVSTNALPAIIKGYIRDITTGTPIANANISTTNRTISSYANGAYIMLTTPGTYTISTTAAGYAAQTTAGITAIAGRVTTQEIKLTSEGTIITKPGDCDNDNTVTIAEVQSAINMFLGLKTAEACVDTSVDNRVSIAEVQKTINSFLGL